VTYTSREGRKSRYTIDASDHLPSKIEELNTAGTTVLATTEILRDSCSCGLPQKIKRPNGQFTTFTVTNGNIVGSRRYFNLYTGMSEPMTHENDIVTSAEFLPIASAQFGVVTKIVDALGRETAINYDTTGSPKTITRPTTGAQSHVETRSYNSYGQLLSVNPPGAPYLELTYYTSGHQNGYLKERKVQYTSTPSAAYLVTTYDYSNFGALTKVKTPKKSAGAGGAEITYTVDKEFLVTAAVVSETIGYTTSYRYNGNRNLVRTELDNKEGTSTVSGNPKWTSESFYDATNQLTKSRSEIEGNSTTVTKWAETQYLYDYDFRLTKTIDPESRETLRVLDADRALLTSISSGTGSEETETSYTYDASARVVTSTRSFANHGGSAIAVESTNFYDSFDRVSSSEDGSGNATVYVYDKRGLVTEARREDSAGMPAVLSKAQYSYDELGRLTLAKGGTGSPYLETAYTYDAASRLTELEGEDGNITKHAYDDAGRTTLITLPSVGGSGSSGENTVTIAYDLNSNVTSRTSHDVKRLGSTNTAVDVYTTYTYDALDRLLVTTYDGTASGTGLEAEPEVTKYDSRGLALTMEDENNVPTELWYDGLGQLTKVTYNSGGTGGQAVVSNYVEFDRSGLVTKEEDDELKETVYAYDTQGRLTKTTHADGDYVKYRYNAIDRVDRLEQGNASTVSYPWLDYSYDVHGLLTKKAVNWNGSSKPTWTNFADYETTESTYTYDAAYRLKNAEDQDSKVELQYDGYGHLTKERLDINLKSGGTNNWKGYKDTVYAYLSTGDLDTVTYPVSGTKFQYGFDPLGRVSEIALYQSALSIQPMVRYSYQGPGGRVARRDRSVDLDAGSGVYTHRSEVAFDELLRPTDLDHRRFENPTPGTTTALRLLDYTWGTGASKTNRLFQRATATLSGQASWSRTYTYDELGRLKTDNDGTDTYTYTLTDAQFLGERKKGMTADRTYTERSDGGSHQLASYQVGISNYTVTHDNRGNLTAGYMQGSTGLVATNFHYDEENRLVHIDWTDSIGDFWFRYDALGRRIVERKGSTDTLFYYSGAHIVIETNSSLTVNRLSLFGIGIDEVVYSGKPSGAGLSSTDHRFPLEDLLGSIIAVYDETNSMNALTSMTYSAYGETTMTGTAYPYAYTGRRLYEGLPLYDYRTRTYDPQLGRFLQRDTIGVWGDRAELGNGYAYVGGDPVGGRDPWGEDVRGFPTVVNKSSYGVGVAGDYADLEEGWIFDGPGDTKGYFAGTIASKQSSSDNWEGKPTADYIDIDYIIGFTGGSAPYEYDEDRKCCTKPIPLEPFGEPAGSKRRLAIKLGSDDTYEIMDCPCYCFTEETEDSGKSPTPRPGDPLGVWIMEKGDFTDDPISTGDVLVGTDPEIKEKSRGDVAFTGYVSGKLIEEWAEKNKSKEVDSP
jgi:RHS repeat-associated protein